MDLDPDLSSSQLELKVILEELPEDPRSRNTKNKKEFNDYGFQLREMTKSLREKYELPKEDALVIISVDPNGEAYSKGIREGDIVKRVGTKKVTNLSDFKKYVKRSNSKGSLLLLIKKSNGDSRFYTLYK